MCESAAPAPAAPSSQTITQSNIPEWAIPYATENLGKAQALTDINKNPYQQYQGQRIADFSPLQQQAFSGIAGMQPNAATSAGISSTQDVAQRAAAQGPYNAQNFGNQYGQGPQFQNMGLGYLSANTQNANDPNVQKSYMSPYQQNVTDFQKQQAIQDAARQLPGMGAMAANAGAFGGSRQAIAGAENQRNLSNQLAGIQATGTQNAFTAGQQAFQSDQARQLQAQLANQGAYGQMQGLGAQQNLAGNQQAMQNAQLMAQYGFSGQQAGEQSRQFGANYGLQNLQQQLAAAGQLGSLGQQQYSQNMGINAAQQQAGAQQQAQAQQGLSQNYQDFLNQQNYPYKQLGFMSDIIRGTPSTASAQTIYQAPPNTIGQIAGAGLGIGALMSGYGRATGKEGGDVMAYKKGGAVSNFAQGGVASLLTPNFADVDNEMAVKQTIKDGPQGGGVLPFEIAAYLNKQLQRLHQERATPPRGTVVSDIARQVLEIEQQQNPQAPQMPQGQPQQPPQGMEQGAQQQGLAQLAQSPQDPQAMRSGGIAYLPSNNFMPDNYAHGGIVAFANRGAVESESFEPPESSNVGIPGGMSQEDYSNLFARTQQKQPTDTDFPSYLKIPTMDEQLAEDKILRERLGIKGLLGEDRIKELGLEKGKKGERKDEAMRDFLMNLGFGAANAASAPGQAQQGLLGSLVTPFAKSGSAAGAAYIADLKDAKKAEAKIDEQMYAINDARRAEARGDITSARSEIDKRTALVEKYDQARAKSLSDAQNRQATIAAAAQRSQPKEMQEYGNAYLSSRQKLGDKRDVDVIRAEGYDKFKSYTPAATIGAANIAAGSAAANTQQRNDALAQSLVTLQLNNIASPLSMALLRAKPEEQAAILAKALKQAQQSLEDRKEDTPRPRAAGAGAPRSVTALPPNFVRD